MWRCPEKIDGPEQPRPAAVRDLHRLTRCRHQYPHREGSQRPLSRGEPSEILQELLHADNGVEKTQGTEDAIILSRAPQGKECRRQTAFQHTEDQRRCAMHLLDQRYLGEKLLHEGRDGGKKHSGCHAATVLWIVSTVISSSWPKACAAAAMASADCVLSARVRSKPKS